MLPRCGSTPGRTPLHALVGSGRERAGTSLSFSGDVCRPVRLRRAHCHQQALRALQRVAWSRVVSAHRARGQLWDALQEWGPLAPSSQAPPRPPASPQTTRLCVCAPWRHPGTCARTHSDLTASGYARGLGPSRQRDGHPSTGGRSHPRGPTQALLILTAQLASSGRGGDRCGSCGSRVIDFVTGVISQTGDPGSSR